MKLQFKKKLSNVGGLNQSISCLFSYLSTSILSTCVLLNITLLASSKVSLSPALYLSYFSLWSLHALTHKQYLMKSLLLAGRNTHSQIPGPLDLISFPLDLQTGKQTRSVTLRQLVTRDVPRISGNLCFGKQEITCARKCAQLPVTYYQVDTQTNYV